MLGLKCKIEEKLCDNDIENSLYTSVNDPGFSIRNYSTRNEKE